MSGGNFPPQGVVPYESSRFAIFFDACYNNAMMANMVVGGLDNLCNSLAPPLRPHLVVLSGAMRQCAAVLFYILEQIRAYPSSVFVPLSDLEILLSSFHKSLFDIQRYYEDMAKSRELRWRYMYHELTNECDIPLPQRFILYHNYLLLLVQVLNRFVLSLRT